MSNNSSNGNSKTFTLPNRFENLRMQDDPTNISFQNKRTDNPSFISNPVLVLHGPVLIGNQNNKHNNWQFICTTEKYLQNYVPQQRVSPGIASYASATKSNNEKVDSHLKRIIRGNLK